MLTLGLTLHYSILLLLLAYVYIYISISLDRLYFTSQKAIYSQMPCKHKPILKTNENKGIQQGSSTAIGGLRYLNMSENI